MAHLLLTTGIAKPLEISARHGLVVIPFWSAGAQDEVRLQVARPDFLETAEPLRFIKIKGLGESDQLWPATSYALYSLYRRGAAGDRR